MDSGKCSLQGPVIEHVLEHSVGGRNFCGYKSVYSWGSCWQAWREDYLPMEATASSATLESACLCPKQSH